MLVVLVLGSLRVALALHVGSHVISPYLVTGTETEKKIKEQAQQISLRKNVFTFFLFLIFTSGF